MSGNDKYQKSFRDLGVYVTDSSGKIRDSNDILDDTLAALKGIDDPATRAALAVQLLGKEAAKIDWTNVKAGRDAITDEQIKALAEYRTQIDKIIAQFERGLLTYFGDLATTINRGGISAGFAKITEQIAVLAGTILNLPTDALNYAWNSLVPAWMRTPEKAAGLGDPLIALANKAKKAREELEFDPGVGAGWDAVDKKIKNVGKGGFGKPSDAVVKAAEESAKRIAQSETEARKSALLEQEAFRLEAALKGSNEIMAIEAKSASDVTKININAAHEIAKAVTSINATDKLSPAQKEKEIAAKRLEIQKKALEEIARVNIKADADILKSQTDSSKKAFDVEQAQIEESAAAKVKMLELEAAAEKATLAQTKAMAITNTIAEGRFELEQKILRMTPLQAAEAKALLDIEEKRAAAIREINDRPNLTPEARATGIDRINEESERAKKLAQARSEEQRKNQEDFVLGWDQAFIRYAENAKNASQQAANYFTTFTKGVEDAIVRFVKTGKLSFKDLANSLIEQLIRVQVQQSIVAASNSVGGLSGLGGLLKAGASFLGLPGFAAGGAVGANSPIVVGERGPELFIPQSAGNIVPNSAISSGGGGLGTTIVNYNISAVDASSFRSLVARDPSFIYAVTEQGRRSQPSRRLTA
jgi:lambda family phage tail tape measure protein